MCQGLCTQLREEQQGRKPQPSHGLEDGFLLAPLGPTPGGGLLRRLAPCGVRLPQGGLGPLLRRSALVLRLPGAFRQALGQVLGLGGAPLGLHGPGSGGRGTLLRLGQLPLETGDAGAELTDLGLELLEREVAEPAANGDGDDEQAEDHEGQGAGSFHGTRGNGGGGGGFREAVAEDRGFDRYRASVWLCELVREILKAGLSGDGGVFDLAREARRQSTLVSGRPSEREALDFLEHAADTRGWE